MADLKQHFNEVAENYDATIEKNLVNYNQMIVEQVTLQKKY